MEYVLNKFKGDLNPGDVILVNDPYNGYCCHLPDWGFYRPIFYKGELLFFTFCRAHQMDTGGAYPGGYFPNAYDIHAEGLCIPPIKVIAKGVERQDVFELLWNNVRWPEAVRVEVQGTADLTMSFCGGLAAFSSGFVKAAWGFHLLADAASLAAGLLLVAAYVHSLRSRSVSQPA